MICYLTVDEQTKEVKTPRLLALLSCGVPRLHAEVQLSGAWIPGVTAVLDPDSHSRCHKVGGPWELSFEKLGFTSRRAKTADKTEVQKQAVMRPLWGSVLSAIEGERGERARVQPRCREGI